MLTDLFLLIFRAAPSRVVVLMEEVAARTAGPTLFISRSSSRCVDHWSVFSDSWTTVTPDWTLLR